MSPLASTRLGEFTFTLTFAHLTTGNWPTNCKYVSILSHNEVLPSLQRLQHVLSLPPIPYSPPRTPVLTKERQASQRTTTALSLRTGHPNFAHHSFGVVFLPALHHFRRCIAPNRISEAFTPILKHFLSILGTQDF